MVIGVVKAHPFSTAKRKLVEFAGDIINEASFGRTILIHKGITQTSNQSKTMRNARQPGGQSAIDYGLDGIAERIGGLQSVDKSTQSKESVGILERSHARASHGDIGQYYPHPLQRSPHALVSC